MTDTPLPPVEPPLPAPKPKLGRGFKLLLAVSLALNLAVAGAVVGVALKARGGDPSRLPIVRDLKDRKSVV